MNALWQNVNRCWAGILFLGLSLLSINALAATHLVTMRNFTFTPASLTINVGDIVTWTNAQGQHDSICGSSGAPCGEWNSNISFGRLMRFRETFSFTFNSPGTFPYYCGPHWELGMSGSITVIAPNVAPSVSILSPGDGQNFSAPANFTVQANASDADGSVTQVEFFLNGTSIGVSGPPYQASANNLGPGNYALSAVATDNSGAQASDSVSITVSGAGPVITTPPVSQIVTSGGEVQFTLEASGSPPLSYQWFFNDTRIEGATGTSLSLTNVNTNDAGTYAAGVANEFGSNSASATLTVTNIVAGTPPLILTNPQSQSVRMGTNVVFSVTAIGSSPIFYQWLANVEPMPNATNSVLVLTNVGTSDVAYYRVVVSNAFGTTNSEIVSLCVDTTIGCQFSLSSSNESFGAFGGTGGVHITASGSTLGRIDCPQDRISPTNIVFAEGGFEAFPQTSTEPAGRCYWDGNVVNTNAWIQTQIDLDFFYRPIGLSFVVLPNTNLTPRSGFILISEIPFLVTQAGAIYGKRGDFTFDGQADFLWQHADGRIALWQMRGTTNMASILLRNGARAGRGWKIIASYDSNADGKTDILWQHADGRLALWVMEGVNFARAELLVGTPRLNSSWRFAGSADFSGDGKEDFIFRHSQGYLLLWVMNGKKFARQQLLFDGEPIPSNWKIIGVADFNNDRSPDILWQNANRAFAIWLMNRAIVTSGQALSQLPKITNARVIGLNDLNQDGKVDLIWRHNNGHFFVWHMNGTNRLQQVLISDGSIVAPEWTLKAPQN